MPNHTEHHNPLALHSDTSHYSLRRLLSDGQDALDPAGVPAVRKIVLRELEAHSHDAANHVVIHKATDLLDPNLQKPAPEESILPKGKLTRATFDIYLDNSDKPLQFSIQPPEPRPR